MKRLSGARIEALALAVVKALAAAPGVEVTNRGEAVRLVAARLRDGFRPGMELDKAVRARIASLTRRVPEGSREWDILYRQYAEELSRRRG